MRKISDENHIAAIKVSVIVPVYNVEKYLGQCLESLVSQTLSGLEIIVVNDGSPDNSQAIIDQYKKHCPHLIRSFIKENGGLSDARNYGIERARGEYLAFVDSDDYVRTDMFELLYDKAAQADADIAVCHFNKVYDAGKVTRVTLKNAYRFGTSVHERRELVISGKSYAWNKIYRRKWFLETGIRYPVGRCFEDSAVTYNLMLSANKVVLVGEALYNYRCGRPGAITTSFNRKFFDIFASCDSIIDFYKDKGAYETFLEEIEYLCTIHIFARVYALLDCPDRKLSSEYIDTAFDYLDAHFPSWRKNAYYYRRHLLLRYNKPSLYERVRGDREALKTYFKYGSGLPRFIAKRLRNAYKYLRKRAGRILKAGRKFAGYIRRSATRGVRRVIGPRTGKLAPARSVPEALNACPGLQNMDLLQSRKVLHLAQQYALEILRTVDRFCRQNDLAYYLAEGTLLGAVRHKGFIPWDDDVDIAMPREDYEKFIALWGRREIDRCVLMHQTTFERHYLAFAKIVRRGTALENKIRICPPEFQGPAIDIFPLDAGGALTDEAFVANYFTIRRYKKILQVKAGFTRNKALIRLHRKQAARMSFPWLHKELTGLMTAYNDTGSGYVANYGSTYMIDREVFPREAFGPPREASFEGYMFYIPDDYNTVLGITYNDYMSLPPEEKRTPCHSYRLLNNSLRKDHL